MNNELLTLKRDWKAYYNAVANRPPRKTILTALAAFDRPGIAVNLGCGDGRDTIEIIRQNWAVLAIDKEADAITRLLARPNLNTLLSFVICPKGHCALVVYHSAYSVSFVGVGKLKTNDQ